MHFFFLTFFFENFVLLFFYVYVYEKINYFLSSNCQIIINN
ncbi:Hypothetical Protein SLY_0500 [Strawberry lethal yellows phytoplasma (CPA) str. NZSb11]|uniref:Uncharacterized protein n=1 Tax=Strawberry lethal yellows phytoplasma (CPA) str. NZSb11 TaxID=980422 RepID=R4RM66_PHYAS|nr:Hypothetical Protein SLY_0500 [Strawberry lethal yellows phytoplasma (CPA) str. NZSb11]